MKVVDMKFYDRYMFRFFFQISENFEFYKGFSKKFGFSKFWGSKTQNFEISR